MELDEQKLKGYFYVWDMDDEEREGEYRVNGVYYMSVSNKSIELYADKEEKQVYKVY